jgi:transposase
LPDRSGSRSLPNSVPTPAVHETVSQASSPQPIHRQPLFHRKQRGTHAEGAGTDESQASRRAQRPDRRQRPEHGQGDPGRERRAETLLALCDPQIQKQKADRLRAALEGNWKDEHLFALRQAHALWQCYQKKIAECDQALEAVLQELAGPEDPAQPVPPVATKRGGVNAPQIAGLHGLLWRLCGQQDPTRLPGVADYVWLQLLGEVGPDLSGPGKNEQPFTAWLGLAPGSRQRGKRRGSQKRSRNRAGRLFCVIARSVGRSVDKALGGFYRRLQGRRGGLVANLALARKLAEMFWRLMVHGRAYVAAGLKKYEEKVAQTEQRLLQKLAAKYNLVLQPKAA